ncbi:MAG TPA: TonB-dependent receptor [Rhizomicrobium sp.]|nr:TonB-dependent receptor [Rhizomicrobium sp.]
MKLSRALLGGFCAAALLSSVAAKADSGLETVVVTAQKRSEDVQAIPITVQAFTAKSIADLGIKASTDLGQFSPNVDIALPAGAGNQPIIAIRGVGLNDYDTNNAGPNGVYLDEVYLSSPASQTFQAFDLDRIEILKGPQGTLYGRNTSGGAINFISAKPTDETTADFHADYGSFDTFQLEGALGGQLADGLDARVAVVHNGSGGYTRNALTGGRENGADNTAGRALLQWKPREDLTVLLNVHAATVANRPAEYRHLGAFDPATGGFCSVAQVYAKNSDCVDFFGYGTPKNFYDGAYERRQHLNVNSWGTSLRADLDLGGVTLTSLSAYERNSKLHPEDSDASPNRELEIDFGVRSSTFTQELRAAHASDDLNWVVGAYYLNEDLRQDQPLYILLDADDFFGGPGTGDGIAEIVQDDSRQVTDSYALYGQGDYALTDKLKLTLGARFTGESKSFRYRQGFQLQDGGMDHFGPMTWFPGPGPDTFFKESISDTAFNWKAVADYRFTPDVMGYVGVSTGFKSGGFNGSFLSQDPAQIVTQLTPIKPEHVTAYEAGVKSTWLDDRLLLDAAGFYNDYSNLQIFVLAPVPNTNLATNILANARKAHMLGADIQIEAKPIDNLTLSAQIGLLNARIDSHEQINVDANGNAVRANGHQLPLSPHVTMSALADYRIPLGGDRLDLQFGASYKSHQFFDVANSPYLTQGDYWLENLRVAYAFDDDKWEVAGYVHNLSGQKYFLDVFDLSFLGFYQGIMGQPRTIGAEADYRF